jgi:hypothetical protein
MLLGSAYFLQENFGPGVPGCAPGFCCFCCVFGGGFGKSGVSEWFFCGQSVVNCVVKMDGESHFLGERNFCRFLNFILRVGGTFRVEESGEALGHYTLMSSVL